ncbi:hypothetical protein BD410DRAFT_845698 [Rickenella mellea]|uniref:CxC2-like cysteine cluster KDZ transposase-associated domain-containing protein n=1 Tax=Rickenella mellea TaxID=50990 RepID=A0A4Y7PK66_9AGAM|nr:hypothetical protein BD410DRAFT_845698 [Rickenella mellea]
MAAACHRRSIETLGLRYNPPPVKAVLSLMRMAAMIGENADKKDRYKYALFLAMDANFRLKSKERGIRDTPLGNGWSYFVPSRPFKEHVSNYVHQPEMNMCESKHRAVDHANIRGNDKLAANGVGGVNCSRHALNRKIGFGDLQRGEKYCNMDYFVLSTLHDVEITTLYLSYDIACQWFVNLPSRIEEYPLRLQVNPNLVVIVAVPKLHLVGHGPKCQTKYSLNYIPGSARTCGESIEQIWSGQNAVSMSTREMSPGCRQDTLDDHLGAWNFRKVVGLGKQLMALLREAISMKTKHKIQFDELSASRLPADIKKWNDMVLAWHADNTRPDPYSMPPSQGSSLAKVKLALAKEESEDATAGVLSPHEMSASTFLSAGLDLEDQQRVLQASAATASSKSTVQAADLQQKRIALRHRIENWRKIQAVYMPGVSASLQDRNPSDDGTSEPANAELSQLFLPSSLPLSARTSALLGLSVKEHRLRLAQAEDCLRQLRRHLRIRLTLWQYKLSSVSGQRATTRTRSYIDRFNEKIQQYARKYRAARAALLLLDPGGKWVNRFQVLNGTDIRGPQRDDGEHLNGKSRESEGRRELTWIWRVAIAADAEDSSEEQDGEGFVSFPSPDFLNLPPSDMRVEWVKSKARAERWDEEVTLVAEEMRRTLAFLEWRAKWWEGQVHRRSLVVGDIQPPQVRPATADLFSGLRAYALKQAAIQHALARRFAVLWVPFLSNHTLLPEVCTEWASVVAAAKPGRMRTSTVRDRTPASLPRLSRPQLADEFDKLDQLDELSDLDNSDLDNIQNGEDEDIYEDLLDDVMDPASA